LQFALTLVATILVSYHLYAHDLFPVTLSLLLFFRYVNSGMVVHGIIASAFLLLLIILFLPVVPHYLIKFSAFGLGALPILLLYTILSVEIVSRRGSSRRGEA
jgi:hypothetical protein